MDEMNVSFSGELLKQLVNAETMRFILAFAQPKDRKLFHAIFCAFEKRGISPVTVMEALVEATKLADGDADG